MVRLTDIVAPGAIVVPLKGGARDDVVTELLDALVGARSVSAALRDELLGAVLEREKKGSTGFGKGVAVPHVKHPGVQRMHAAIGLSARGLDFSALDRQPVYSVFMLVSPLDRPDEHLQAMEAIFRSLSKETFRRFLRQATTPQEVLTLLEEADVQQLPG